MIVVIDDERTFQYRNNPVGPQPDPIYFRNSTEGLAFLAEHWTNYWNKNGEPIDQLWLDHDLGENDDIRRVVDFIYVAKTVRYSSQNPWINEILVHSQNPTTDWIVNLLAPWFKTVERVPLPHLVE